MTTHSHTHSTHLVVSTVVALTIVGCGSDVVESTTDGASGKGIVDEMSLADQGVMVRLEGDVGTVEVPFLVPVPSSAQPEQLSAELDDAASLLVRSDVTGTTADLSSGRLVEDSPDAPGEFTWALNDSRDRLTLRFFNETAVGTTLKTDRSYTASLQVSSNDYVEDVPSLSVAVTVVD